ncbi:hypothetical protein OK074_4353 [Actinobacteria bacterium OK074]|nr:hypothetical protein OK074_4353 [Actinobacteria bacterium OK074]
MTTLSAPAAVPGTTARPSPVPGLLRTLLRLHRPALYGWAAFVVALSGVLLWLRGPLTTASAAGWKQYDACGWTPRCTYDQDAILLYKNVYTYGTWAVLAVPLVAAAWAGAALIGREMELGTAQLAWTQGVSPGRWLAAKLVLPAVAIGVGTGLLVTLHHLAWSAGRSRIDTAKSWDETWTFQAGGPITVALALCGLAVGVLVGLLWRRSLAALGAAAVGTVAVWYGISRALPHLWPTVTRVVPLGGDGPAYDGMVVETGVVTASGAHRPIPDCISPNGSVCDKAYEAINATGYYTEYHPKSQYWGLQLASAGVLLALTAVLVAVGFWMLRRRTGATAAQ